jgi:hypothetical protein
MVLSVAMLGVLATVLVLGTPSTSHAALLAFDGADANWQLASLPKVAQAFDPLYVQVGDSVLFRFLPEAGVESNFTAIVEVPDQRAWDACDAESETPDSDTYDNESANSVDDIWLLDIT